MGVGIELFNPRGKFLKPQLKSDPHREIVGAVVQTESGVEDVVVQRVLDRMSWRIIELELDQKCKHNLLWGIRLAAGDIVAGRVGEEDVLSFAHCIYDQLNEYFDIPPPDLDELREL